MRFLYLVSGIVVLVAVILDILWTTLWVDGGSGPLSTPLTTGIWGGLRRVSSKNERVLSLAGPLILTATLTLWIVGLWVGWSLVFAGEQLSLISTRTGLPADWAGRVYYVAYMMFTAGNGDYAPTTDGWELASAATTASGMALVTLGVSYVLTVLGAVSEKRAFASAVTGLGDRSESFVRSGYAPHAGFTGLDQPLESLASDLDLLADQHRAYPILHYYHSEQPENSSAVAVAILGDALTILEGGIDEEPGPTPPILRLARASTNQYLETLDAAFIDPADDAPPPPALDRVRAAGIETVSDEAFADFLQDRRDHRRQLLGVVRGDAWMWPPVDEKRR